MEPIVLTYTTVLISAWCEENKNDELIEYTSNI